MKFHTYRLLDDFHGGTEAPGWVKDAARYRPVPSENVDKARRSQTPTNGKNVLGRSRSKSPRKVMTAFCFSIHVTERLTCCICIFAYVNILVLYLLLSFLLVLCALQPI